MLQTLYIENIAVIEKTSIDFKNGLNVLTGETGAGKSIIIDAINAIFGSRVYLGSEKPTNSEFIALVADKLILEILL